MHEAALSRAALPEPAVVLQMLLRPLSLGHIVAFNRHGVFESIAAGAINPTQLTVAVLVCCQSWDQLQLARPDYLESFKLWIWKVRVKRAAKRFSKSVAGTTYYEHEAEKFARYLRAGAEEFPISDTPRPGGGGSSSRSPGCPFLLRLHQWLVSFLGLSESQAWDYPFGLAKMRWSCHWEAQGGLDVENEADESFNRFVMEQESKAGGN